MAEFKSGKELFSIYFHAAWITSNSKHFFEKICENMRKNNETILAMWEHKNAHVGPETAHCSLRPGAAERRRLCIKKSARQRASVRDC